MGKYYCLYKEMNDLIGRVSVLIINPYPEKIVGEGLLVDEIPNAETPDDMYPRLMMNLDTNELFYNYEALPDPSIPDEMLADKVTTLESDLGNLLLENAEDKATIATLEDTIGNLLFEVAALKRRSRVMWFASVKRFYDNGHPAYTPKT